MILGILFLASMAAGPADSGSTAVDRVVIDTSGLANTDRTQGLLLTAGAKRLQQDQVLIERSTLIELLKRVGEEELLGPGESVKQLILTRTVSIERVFDPMVAGPVLERYSGSPRLRAIAAELQRAEFNECSSVARAYDLAAQARDVPTMKLHGPGVDAHCLQSLLSWRRADGEFRSDLVPPLLEFSESSGLAALAILELQAYNDEIRYVCGGLLKPGNRVLTAAHCFGEFPSHRTALEEGRMRVRLARDPLGPSWPVKALLRSWKNPEPVQSDVVELEIASDKEIPAPPSEFVPFQENSKPLVLGYFPHFDSTREIEGDTDTLSKFPAWFRGLRWSRPGLCHAINASDRCVRLLCQTINGYSGSPVFDQTAQVPGRPLRILGLVSRPDHSQAACAAFLDYSTLAYTDVRQPAPPPPIVGNQPSVRAKSFAPAAPALALSGDRP